MGDVALWDDGTPAISTTLTASVVRIIDKRGFFFKKGKISSSDLKAKVLHHVDAG